MKIKQNSYCGYCLSIICELIEKQFRKEKSLQKDLKKWCRFDPAAPQLRSSELVAAAAIQFVA